MSNLVGAREIADRLGVKLAQTVHDWHHRYDAFPEPVARLSAGYVWNWPDVAAWARSTGRMPQS